MTKNEKNTSRKSLIQKELISKLGEETIYSAKGHFKACDIRRRIVTFTISLCLILSVLDLAGIFTNDMWLDIGGVLGALFLLMWNQGESKNYRKEHKHLAELYLALHKEVRKLFYSTKINTKEINELSDRISQLDLKQKLEIPYLAKRWAKYSIERKDPETDNWFKIQ